MKSYHSYQNRVGNLSHACIHTQIGINRMMERYGCQEIELETEVSNVGATQLYLKLGFIKDFRLSRYYLNGGDAFRLRLDLRKIQEPLLEVSM